MFFFVHHCFVPSSAMRCLALALFLGGVFPALVLAGGPASFERETFFSASVAFQEASQGRGAESSTEAVVHIGVDVDAQQLAGTTDRLAIELDGKGFAVQRVRAEHNGESLLWVGEILLANSKAGRGRDLGSPSPGSPDLPGIAAFYRDAEERVYGIVMVQGASYRLWPDGSGGHTLTREQATGEAPECALDGSAGGLDLDLPLNPPTHLGPSGFASAKAGPVKQRILIGGGEEYTQQKGGIKGLVAWSELLVAVANQFYVNGGINLELELAHVHPGTEDWLYGGPIPGMKDPADGYHDALPVLREDHAADMVILLLHRTSDNQMCGLVDEILGGEETAYGYVASGGICGPETYTFVHEIGHLQGAAHNYLHAGHSGPSWAYGYRVPDGPNPFRTVMSYGSDIPRIPYFSNPFQIHVGQPIGTWEAFNAYQLWLTREEVAAYRTGDGASTLLLPLPYTTGSLWANSGSERHYAVQVAASPYLRKLRVELSGGRFSTGDADLYLRADTKPTTTVFDCAKTSSGNNHVCEIQNPPAGTYRIMVLADSGYTGVELDVRLTSGIILGGGAQ